MERAGRIATIGDNCIDRYLPLGVSAVGGNAVNVAVQLVRSGRDCAYFGAVGSDAAGARTRLALAANGVGLAHLHERPGRTSQTDLDVDACGERFIVQEDFGVCADYWPTEEDLAALRGMRHVHIGWLKQARRLREALAGAGVSFSQDVAVNAEDGGLDLAFGSAGPSLDVAERMLDRLLRAGNRIAVVTCGPLGSLASDGAKTIATGIRAVEVVDTTGAGDTFIAGFLGAWLDGLSLKASLAAGRDAAAETCRHLGGFPQECLSL